MSPADKPDKPDTAEHRRLAEATGRAEDDLFDANPWYEWGPYLSERAWGTVREDYSDDGDAWGSFPHDHARSRAYRWNEDGMAGLSDIHHELCLALSLWNGVDPILKERMFGLTGPQGNHGEDAKEYWWYLEGLPSHALLRWRYHYPQAAVPLPGPDRGERPPRAGRLRVRAARHRRLRRRPLLGRRRHLRQGVADRGARAHHRREPRPRRGDDRRAADAVVPQHVAWPERTGRARAAARSATRSSSRTTGSAGYRLEAAPGPTAQTPRALFCDNETNTARLYGAAPVTAYPKDGINDHVVSGAATVNPAGEGTKAAWWYHLTVPAGGTAEVRLRLHRPRGRRRVPDRSWSAPRGSTRSWPTGSARPTSSTPRSRRPGTDAERMRVLRQACAGLVWSKQIYPYRVSRWLDGDPASPPPPRGHRSGRNADWRHLDSFDVLAMPDPWEYPWFAAWDLAFHAIPWAHLDPAFAKYQLMVLLREWFQHPNGALPAYEWNFDDVNPPVHALAAIRVFVIDGGTDVDFLERVFQKLLLNFTWWLNRQDPDGNNLFGGGFLGLDNISPVDRSHLPPGLRLEQADGTAWMAYYSLAMLVLARTLAERNPVYDDMVVKFLEQFVLIIDALESSGLYDPEDGFFYDRLIDPHGNATPIQVQTLVGVIPALPAASVSLAESESVQRLRKRFARRLERVRARGRPGVADHAARAPRGACSCRWSRRTSSPECSRRCSTRRRSSRRTACGRCRSGTRRRTTCPGCPTAGSTTSRPSPGPRCTAATPTGADRSGSRSTTSSSGRCCSTTSSSATTSPVEYPTGSGTQLTLGEIAGDLADRLVGDLAARRRRPTAGVRRSGRPRPTRRGTTTCCSSSTSTATSAPGSAPRTRPAGPRWSPTSSSTRPGRRAEGTGGLTRKE